MRGGVNAIDLFYTFGYEDRVIINAIIKDNIDNSKKTGMNLI